MTEKLSRFHTPAGGKAAFKRRTSITSETDEISESDNTPDQSGTFKPKFHIFARQSRNVIRAIDAMLGLGKLSFKEEDHTEVSPTIKTLLDYY